MSETLRIIPLGGLGEVGKNMMAIEYDGQILVIDAGLMFPENDMLGIDLVIPDYGYLLDRKEQVLAVILTHGHEDHIGALPYLLREINATPTEELVEKLAFGLMAGNLFDHGALAAIERYQTGASEFRQLRDAQPVRPWFIDGVDAWRRRWSDGSAYEHVAFFVDNAGPDICLGCLPFIRWMLQEGSRVTLVANTGPVLNDVTAPEVLMLLDRIADLDDFASQALRSGRLAVIASGNSTPLIDLTRLTKQCAETLGDADLIVLHGMGRAIESNYHAAFSCDCLRSAVLKVGAVAKRLGGRLFDCVFQLQCAS